MHKHGSTLALLVCVSQGVFVCVWVGVCEWGTERRAHTIRMWGCVFERTLQLALRALFVVGLSGFPLSQLGTDGQIEREREIDKQRKRERGTRGTRADYK